MQALLDWLDGAPNRGATLCRAGSQYFVRLCLPGYWKLEPKDFPIEFASGYQNKSTFSCIGYSDLGYEAAITEAMKRLPGS